jgi:hypothetical protein
VTGEEPCFIELGRGDAPMTRRSWARGGGFGRRVRPLQRQGRDGDADGWARTVSDTEEGSGAQQRSPARLGWAAAQENERGGGKSGKAERAEGVGPTGRNGGREEKE